MTWFEKPVSSEDLSGLVLIRAAVTAEVTAGEYGYNLAYFCQHDRRRPRRLPPGRRDPLRETSRMVAGRNAAPLRQVVTVRGPDGHRVRACPGVRPG